MSEKDISFGCSVSLAIITLGIISILQLLVIIGLVWLLLFGKPVTNPVEHQFTATVPKQSLTLLKPLDIPVETTIALKKIEKIEDIKAIQEAKEVKEIADKTTVKQIKLSAQQYSQNILNTINNKQVTQLAENVCGYKSAPPPWELQRFLNQNHSTVSLCKKTCSEYMALLNTEVGEIKNGLDLPVDRMSSNLKSQWHTRFTKFNQKICQLSSISETEIEEIKLRGGYTFSANTQGLQLLNFCQSFNQVKRLCPIN